MCSLCASYEMKIEQFRRALTQPLDELSKRRISTALVAIRSTKPACMEREFNYAVEPKIVDLQLHRVNAALDALSQPELDNLV